MKERERRRIAIIGLGLIGGSLGLAIKAAGLKNLELVGYDRVRDVEGRAQKRGAIDRAEHNLPLAVQDASLVIVATPILAIRQVLEEIAPHLAEGAIVTDTGSSKALVLQWADGVLPAAVSFVGGHPLAGQERQGIDNADATLFADKAYAIVPSVKASEAAIQALLGMIRLIGARPLFLEAAEHDQYVAAVSHVPLILSTALFTLVRGSPGWADLAPVAASAFRDLTRLASGEPEMSHDICLTNRDAVLHWLDRLLGELYRLRHLIEGDSEALFKTFIQARADRDQFMAQGPPPRPVGREMPEVRHDLFASLFGGAITERARRVQEALRERSEGSQAKEEGGERKPSRAERGLELFRQRLEEGIRRDLEKGHRQ